MNLLVLESFYERADWTLLGVLFSKTSRGRAHLSRLKAAILLCPQLLPNYQSGAGKDYTSHVEVVGWANITKDTRQNWANWATPIQFTYLRRKKDSHFYKSDVLPLQGDLL